MSGSDQDIAEAVATEVRDAAAARAPLEIIGGGSKRFLGRATQAAPLEVGGHRGILAYEPTELTVTARAGTPLSELEAALHEAGQCLPFEPPHLGENATLGGTIACGLSGPRRPYAGAARDFVLGVRIVNGRGERLRFGGAVMKNVAGYDLSRLMVGAMGTLGVLLDVSLKVLPRPAVQATQVFELSAADAIRRANEWAAQPLPLAAAVHVDGRAHLRLAGTAGGVQHAITQIGGETLAEEAAFWADWREQRHPFFTGDTALWRLSLPPTTPPLELPGRVAVDWGGGLRWLKTDLPAARLRDPVTAAGGHATLFRAATTADDQPFHPLAGGMHRLHQRLKDSLDPQRVLNRGRMHADL